jgi:hypothetical protein
LARTREGFHQFSYAGAVIHRGKRVQVTIIGLLGTLRAGIQIRHAAPHEAPLPAVWRSTLGSAEMAKHMDHGGHGFHPENIAHRCMGFAIGFQRIAVHPVFQPFCADAGFQAGDDVLRETLGQSALQGHLFAPEAHHVSARQVHHSVAQKQRLQAPQSSRLEHHIAGPFALQNGPVILGLELLKDLVV